MFLKALEMQGFKSFPDKTVLEFNNGITSVVGPNGSGKSNISDAVRWVLGEQSTKNLRGSKMEDVIFDGTDIRKAKGFAEVTLRLDNTDRTLDKDTDEVSVTRRYYRSGESEYLINGESSRLRDINELFMDTGLGRDGYSLVGQGKIADMVSSRTNERRDMLEEAAGISHFRYRRSDAMKRLAQAEENLVRLRDILTELETRIGPLKTQSEKAQKFIVLAEERKNLEIGIWLNTIDKTNDKLREQEHRISTAEVNYKAAEDELRGIEEKMDAASDSVKEINIKIEEIRNSSSVSEEQIAALETQVKVEENSILHNNETVERLRKDKADEDETEQHLDDRIKEAEENIKNAGEKIKVIVEELNKLSEKQEEFKSSNLEFSDRAQELSALISSLSVELADNRVISETASSSIDEIKSRISAIDESLGGRQDVYNQYKQNKEKAEKALEDCKAEIVSVTNSMDGYSMRYAARGKKADECEVRLREKARELQNAQDRIKILEDLEKSMEGYGGAVKSVMHEASRKTLRGICGPVSQLITVKDKYSLAIETALGAAVQNIVVENENDAKRAIEHLKNAKAGRATFLPITAIKSRELTEKGLDDEYGFISVADRLVECDKKYREVIGSLLARTVVCDDMDCAVAIAKKYNYRFKAVTLDGQVVNAGGSMTGGSRTQNAGILSRGNEIERLKKNLSVTENEIKTLEADFKRLSEDKAAALADLEGAQGDLLRQNEEKIRLEGELKLANEQFDTLSGNVKELSEEKETLLKRIDSINDSAANAVIRIEELNAVIKNNEEELEKITGDREKIASSREELSEKASELSMQKVALEKDIQTNEDTLTHLNARKQGHTDKATVLDSEINAILEKNAQKKKDIENLLLNIEELKKASSSSRAQIDELISQRGEFEKQQSDLRLIERNKTSEREQLGNELARLEEKKIAMRKEYDDLTAKLYDEYQLTRREAAALEIEIEDYAAAGKRLTELKNQIRALGSVNVSAIDEYKEVSERYEFMSEQVADIEKSKAELTKLITELTGKMALQFRESFNKINQYFGETFSELFGGGKAELKLENELDILECDILIKVQPPGKNVKNIDLLSGGEKAISAIALLFALLKAAPAPFCIFDEVEAALDDINVVRYANYVRRMTRNTQFILITHRRGTMEEADVLYGVTMQEKGVSKLLELKTAEMARKLGLA
ncbi:MAG: chromosome segregation protein SMC [Ruminococcaceae bacterium]|nr:chromosome segregation protein SMC [Oscillospiraceae bacterium]